LVFIFGIVYLFFIAAADRLRSTLEMLLRAPP